MENNFKHRMGTFFIIVGLTLLLIFLGSMMSKEVNIIYLFLAFAALSLGFMLRRGRPVHESERFGTLRRIGESRRLRREDRMNKKHPGRGSSGRRRQTTYGRDHKQENNGNERENE